MHKKVHSVFTLCVVVFSMFFNISGVWAAQLEELIFPMEEIIVIASKYPEELIDSLASVETISREEITISQAENLAEVIRNVSGLEIADYGYPGGIKTASIRGSSPEQVLIMIDGQVVNNPQSGKIDLGQIPTDIIEKIEIYRGPASALYGANALGGVINIITRGREGGSHWSGAIYGGSYNTQKYQLSYQNQNDDTQYFLTGHYYKTDGERENSQLDKINFMSKISRKLDQQTNLDLTIRYYDQQQGLPGPSDHPTPNAEQEDRDFNVNLKWQKQEEDRDINLMIWHDTNRRYYDNPGEWEHTGPSTHKTYTMGLSFDYTQYDLSFNDEGTESGHILTWGAEIKHNRLDSSEVGYRQDLNGAAFIQDSWQPAELENLKVTAGVRYDYNQIFGGQLNPRVGFTYRLQDELSFHASIGRAYRAPTYDDLYWPEDGYVGGNPDLLPETAWAHEAGLRFINDKGDTQAELNVFQNNVSQLINWAPDSEGVWRPSNIGSAQINGVEVLLKKEFNQHFRGNLNYTYLDAKDLDTNNQLKPNHKWGLGLSYTDQIGDDQDNFTAGLNGYIVAGRPDGLENYYIVDANITRDLTLGNENDQKIKLSFSIKNLFDQRPELVSGYPIQGRTFMLGISTNF